MVKLRFTDGRTIHVDDDRLVAEIESNDSQYGRDIAAYDPFVNPGNVVTAADAGAALRIAHTGAINLAPGDLSRAIARVKTVSKALTQLEPGVDLFTADEGETLAHINGPVRAALTALVSVKHVNVALASKLLHLKRPNLFPILDRYPFAFYSYIYFDKPKERNVETGLRLLREFRADGRNNLDVLAMLGEKMDRAAGSHLPAPLTVSLSPVRVLDRIIWRHVKKRTG